MAARINGGLSSARNAGLDVATGKFIAFVDSDDWIEPTMLETMLGWMRKHTAVDVVMCGTEKDYEDGRKEHIDGQLPEREFNSDEALHDFFTGIGRIRFPEGLNNEDYYVLAQVYRTMRGILFNPKALYHYRIRPDSITTAGLNTHSFDRAKVADKCRDSEALKTWRKELATKAKPVYRDASVGFAEKMKIRMLACLPKLYVRMTQH